MDLALAGKKAIVSGASRGIGLAIASCSPTRVPRWPCAPAAPRS